MCTFKYTFKLLDHFYNPFLHSLTNSNIPSKPWSVRHSTAMSHIIYNLLFKEKYNHEKLMLKNKIKYIPSYVYVYSTTTKL